MKINSKQAQLLAKKIVEELKENNAFSISAAKKEKIESFVSKRRAIIEKKSILDSELNALDRTFNSVVGNVVRCCSYYDKLEKIIRDVENSQVPSLEEIQDEIILKSMFQSEDDMQSFVNGIVSKYSKKIKVKL